MKNGEDIYEHHISSQESNTSSTITDEKSARKVMRNTRKCKMKFSKNTRGLVSLYITSCERNMSPKVTIQHFTSAVPSLDTKSSVETNYGLILNVANDDVQKILNMNLAKTFGKPVQVVPLLSDHFRKYLKFKEVPWCIRNEEIEICLKTQGINFEKITRNKSTMCIELSDFLNYHRLQEEGINFYNSVVFRAMEDIGTSDDIIYNSDNIIQCYRCQGFWHTANTCKQNIRCVRCGEEHSVENCNRPKHNPVCCNCKGPHHAAYKLCPIRLKLKKSIRVSFSFSQ